MYVNKAKMSYRCDPDDRDVDDQDDRDVQDDKLITSLLSAAKNKIATLRDRK